MSGMMPLAPQSASRHRKQRARYLWIEVDHTCRGHTKTALWIHIRSSAACRNQGSIFCPTGSSADIQDEGKFDPKSIPLKSWNDYENELWDHESLRRLNGQRTS
jgi:hypothetical protein